MRIIDCFHRPHSPFSFEFFPPKTEEGEAKLWEVLRSMNPLAPNFVSVTYGAGGSTGQRTAELTRRIKAELSIETMAHLTCVGSSEAELIRIMAEYAETGIENLMLLRGDPPRGQSEFLAPQGGFRYASDLVKLAKKHFDFCCGAACYPEKHPEAPSFEVDVAHLKTKVDAGADFLVTQLFYDNGHYFRFVERCRKAGITVPILPGIMPITNVDQVKRLTGMCHASIPQTLLTALEAVKEDAEQVMHIGVAHAENQARALLAGGAPGIHFYTLNRSPATRRVVMALRQGKLAGVQSPAC